MWADNAQSARNGHIGKFVGFVFFVVVAMLVNVCDTICSFQDVTAIIFCVAMNEYDMKVSKHPLS